MCVGYPCAFLAHQSKHFLTKLSKFNNAIIFCIMVCTAVYPLLCFIHKPTYHRILMNVKYDLCKHFLIQYFYWLVMLLPKLPIAIITLLLPALSLIHSIHSRLLSCGCSFISFFNWDEVWLFISLTISSNGLS